MELKLFGAAKEVTGSCYSIDLDKEKILIDCGMFQGGKATVRKNYEDFGFNPSEYKALLLTHAHLDHCGRIPKLVKAGFKGKIYCIDATKELALVIMTDSAKIAAEDTKHENKRRALQNLPAREPIYNDKDVSRAMSLFSAVKYDEDIKITENITARFYDAGHILGAASIQIKANKDKKTKPILIAFSGDIGQKEAILVKNTEPIEKADYAFIESTYGDRLHPPIEQREKEFLRILNENYKRGGKLMIPSFAVERAQEILYLIGDFMQKGLIPKMKVYLDSPMAMKATKVFAKYTKYYNSAIQKTMETRKNPFTFPELVITETVDQSKAINFITEPCIVIAGNGMCSAGRIKHHIRNSIENPKNTLMFIGYQAEGTLGYWIKKGEKRIRLLGIEADVNAKIENIEGFSAHADYNGLLSWLNNFNPKPKKVFICHGEEKESISFADKADKNMFKTYIPGEGEELRM